MTKEHCDALAPLEIAVQYLCQDDDLVPDEKLVALTLKKL